MAGTREKLLQGEWTHQSPMGYDHIRRNGERFIVVNETGKLLRKAFQWKAIEGIPNEEAIKRLAALGINVSSQKI